MNPQATKLLKEIEIVAAPKLWNIQHGTATEKEKQVVDHWKKSCQKMKLSQGGFI